MVRVIDPPEDADIAPMSGAGEHPMAVLLKEANSADGVPADVPISGPLVPPFDVVSYTGAISIDGYERLNTLLEERATNDNALVVLETPGGDPHAAFRIARALGSHYRRVEVLVTRDCKSAGTLVVIGASVLHMSNRGELGPLDIQVPRAHEFSSRGSALEVSDALDVLLPHQLRTFDASMDALVARGLPTESAANAASLMVSRLFRPITEQIDPRKLVEMARAMALCEAYGDRLASIGRNIDSKGVRVLARRYPSHGFSIDRAEARQLFRDVRAPEGAVAEIARRYARRSPSLDRARKPAIEVMPFFPTTEESIDEQGIADVRVRNGQGASGSSDPGDVSRSVRSGSEVCGPADGRGGSGRGDREGVGRNRIGAH